MQAIATRYFGPSETRSAKVKATAQAGSVSVTWDDALDQEANHDAAAVALCRKYGWTGVLVRGGAPDGIGNVYVFFKSGMGIVVE